MLQAAQPASPWPLLSQHAGAHACADATWRAPGGRRKCLPTDRYGRSQHQHTQCASMPSLCDEIVWSDDSDRVLTQVTNTTTGLPSERE